jgi:hypothetical protein
VAPRERAERSSLKRAVEKLQMLARGELARGIDGLDLVFHANPRLLLLAKPGRAALRTA